MARREGRRFVTGASFGSHLVAHLECQHSVFSQTRTSAFVSTRYVTGRPQLMHSSMQEGMDAVYHLAGAVSRDTRTRIDVRRPHRGTRQILQACHELKVKKS